MKYQALPWHDYKLPSIYHITLTQLPGCLPFSVLEGTPTAPRLTLTPFGKATEVIIRNTLNNLPFYFLGCYKIMPDHIHMIVTVKRKLKRSIRMEVAVAKSQISKTHSSMRGFDTTQSVFKKDFHHRIIFSNEELETCKAYIRDNPRRLLVKRSHPDLFRVYNHLIIGDMEMAAYGNIFLLRDYQKMAVGIHHWWSEAELHAYRQRCLMVADNEGVLVSPWIHDWEREIRNEAIERGARIITLRADGFQERFKPQGHEFELCSEGRLLLLAPWPDAPRTPMSRSTALTLNGLASRIASFTHTDPATLRNS